MFSEVLFAASWMFFQRFSSGWVQLAAEEEEEDAAPRADEDADEDMCSGVSGLGGRMVGPWLSPPPVRACG